MNKTNNLYKLFSCSAGNSMFGINGVMPMAYLDRLHRDHPGAIHFLESLKLLINSSKRPKNYFKIFINNTKPVESSQLIMVSPRYNKLGKNTLNKFILGSYGVITHAA